MNKLFIYSALGMFMASSMATYAQNEDPDYLRSSLYTVIIKSNEQNKRLEEENQKTVDNLITETAKDFAGTAQKKAANDTYEGQLTDLPATVFLSIPIPPQFNDHNLETRVIEYDVLQAGMTEDDITNAQNKLDPEGKKGLKKKSKAGGFMKGLASKAMGAASGSEESTMLKSDPVDDYGAAVVLKFIETNNIPSQVVARWFDYDPNGESHWGYTTFNERALESLSIKEQGLDGANQSVAAGKKAMLLIPQTYLLATNLKFRSNQAVLAEAQAMANVAGSMLGGYGQLASQVAGAAAGAAAGDGYQVQANSYLFKLVWNEDLEDQIGKMLQENATLEELINSGLCTLEFVGKEKAGARVRQSLFSDKPISSLVERATARAVDASIAKLQEKHEEFRTIFPISSSNGDGTINVKIGTREGVSKGDQYAILEQQEDPKTGMITYKQVGTVKPEENKIWNNVAGAEEELAENKANSKGKDNEFDDNAVNLGYTTFTGAKKGQDYKGYFVQLKKKK